MSRITPRPKRCCANPHETQAHGMPSVGLDLTNPARDLGFKNPPLARSGGAMAEPLLVRADKTAGRECRVYERLACDLPAACRPAAAFNNKEATWSAVIR